MTQLKIPKKLIEVSLPLDDINEACEKEKQPFTPKHPRSIHIWWARRPLAAARAVLFAQLVNDPGYERHLQRGINKEAAQKERERLFNIMRRLVKWENTANEEVLNEARVEIWKSWRETCELNKGVPGFDPGKLPAFHDPFAGGGSIPLEAQRLGLESYASDLNPIAVTINKAILEFPSKFAGLPPVNPESQEYIVQTQDEWSGARGLTNDIIFYGKWMAAEARKRIGHYYPEVGLPSESGGGNAKVIAWIWARTVKSPNPAFSHIDVPLLSTYWLSTKPGKEVYVEPVISGDDYSFKVVTGVPVNPEVVKSGTKVGRGGNFTCLLSGSPISVNYIRSEGQANRIGQKLIAIVAEIKSGKLYLSPNENMEEVAVNIELKWKPDLEINYNPRDIRTQLYGLNTYDKLFTPRQILALNTFSDLVNEVKEKVVRDGILAERQEDESKSYGNAVATYLALATSRWSDMSNSLCSWNTTNQNVRALFSRQAIPMTWDFVELSPFSKLGSWYSTVESISALMSNFAPNFFGAANQVDAQLQSVSMDKIISTDPPYYDNIGYADLSDFFYVWLRRMMKEINPSLFATVAVPKEEELVATPYRHGTKEKAESFFMNGMTRAMHNLATQAHPAFPTTIYYAFKQSDTNNEGTASTGWVTFLEAVITAGFTITGTWPLRTERAARSVSLDSNALASSIVLVCRKRPIEVVGVSRRSFIRELNENLPTALEDMVGGNQEMSPIAAVDLQQAAIGPGIAIYSKYSAVLEADGSTMSVKSALQLINRVVDTFLNATNGDLDTDTLFSINWFEQYGWNTGEYGQAEVLATAKGTAVDGLHQAGVLNASHGKVRLFKWQEYPAEWRPEQDNRTPVWEALHQLIRALQQQGEQAAGSLLAGMPDRSEAIRNLSYRLYTICERKGWADDARGYNELIASWDAIEAAAHEIGHHGTQIELF